MEAVEGPARLVRFSFIGVDPSASFRGGTSGHRLRWRGEERELRGSLLEALRQALALDEPCAPRSGLPPFCGGWVGWFAYEWSSELEPSVPRAQVDRWQVPNATLERYDEVVAFDHAAQKVYVFSPVSRGAEEYHAAQARVDTLAREAFDTPGNARPLTLDAQPAVQLAPAEYRSAVQAMRDAIRQGEIFQGVPSQRFEQTYRGDLFTLYRILRLTNASPHMFYFEADGLTLIGSSPERLVSVRDGTVENKPIAGTRPRGATPEADRRLAQELLESEKECAEHDMLVDLARNDLGRIARVGSVRVKEHRVIERFARVQHIVSRVEGELAPDKDALDALVACFPAGTVTGAPKVRAQQLIASIERETRGPYAGAFGYLDAAGNLDMALTIRTFAAREGILTAQAGAGVVFDSDPEAERLETIHKAQALFDAANLANAPPFRSSEEIEP